MGKTTNILDLNNRLEKVEKGNVAQNSYISLKNKPKINSVTLTGNKSLDDIGAAAAADLGALTDLTTTNKNSVVGAINELDSKITIQTSAVSDLVLAKFNDVVFVNGAANLPCTIPEGFRPQTLTKVPCIVAGTGADVVSILPTGVLEYGALGTQTGTVIFQAVYM